MDIGLISDIHGSLIDLEAALAILQREGVDRIVCAGDLVDFGPHSHEVIERLSSLNIPCVQGNHDRSAKDNEKPRLQNPLLYPDAKPYSRTALDFLNRLPIQLRFTWEGVHVLLTHANPWGDDQAIGLKSTPAQLRRVVETAQADITIIGHSHVVMWIDIEGQMIINPGSVANNYNPLFNTCGILSLPARQFRFFNLETGEEAEITKRILPRDDSR